MLFFLSLVIAVIVLVIITYNTLQTLAQDIREKASNAQIAISKKLALVNQLIDVVKNYQEGEQLVQLKVSQDTSDVGLAGSYQQSGAIFATMQGLAERFPNLKANEQYHRLVDSIQECEQNIQYCREKYNHAVKQYNTKRLKIPIVFLAKPMGFSEAPYMEFDLSGAHDVTTLQNFKADDGERLQQIFSDAGNKITGMAKEAGKAGMGFVKKIKEGKGDKAIPNQAGDEKTEV